MVSGEVTPDKKSDVAKRYRLSKGGGVGVISASQSPFVAIAQQRPGFRQTADFSHASSQAGDRPLDDDESRIDRQKLAKAIETTWTNREDRYSEIRSEQASASNRMRCHT